MQLVVSRRSFLRCTSATLGLAALGSFNIVRAGGSAASKVRVGIIGCNNRGMDHISGFLSVPEVEIAYICDVDSRAVAKGIAAAAKKQTRSPKGVQDLRRVLEDPEVDAVSIATPDHWHSPATILACKAGKHVYIEKPGSHNANESALIVAAARKHKRVVQMGNQRRSWPWVVEAMAAMHAGEIGKVFLARGWYVNHRPTIGKGKLVPVPEWLNYDLWQGPAPERPFRDNVIHYNWHWFWHWGTGELGNNGVHALDLARWGLGVDAPRRVTCAGNRYHYQDDWETPDVTLATFDFGHCGIVWEGQSCDPHGFENSFFGVNFYGEKGAMLFGSGSCRVLDLNNKLIREIKGPRDDVAHFANFADAIRMGNKLNAEIEEGQKATMLCHLGNIAWRSGQTVDFDPAKRFLKNGRKVAALWRRDYRRGWEPKV